MNFNTILNTSVAETRDSFQNFDVAVYAFLPLLTLFQTSAML